MAARMSPLPYPGGKGRFASRILALLPEPRAHWTYCEPFCGSASVLLSRPAAGLEVLNDANADLMTFFQVLRNIPYSRALYTQWAPSGFRPEQDIQRAARVFFLARASMMAAWQRSTPTGFAVAKGEDRPGAMANAVKDLLRVRDRLRRVVLECDDALAVIRRYDSENTVFYCDPPYLSHAASHNQNYAHGYSVEQHVQLLRELKKSRGYVALSGYPSELYTGLLETDGWTRVDFHTTSQQVRPRDGSQVNKSRTESVWLNPRLAAHVHVGDGKAISPPPAIAPQ